MGTAAADMVEVGIEEEVAVGMVMAVGIVHTVRSCTCMSALVYLLAILGACAVV